MNTNHNRIKVSDLETDEPDKILATNSNGELEFIATKNIKVDSYNALDYEQEGKALDARQGKILKDLVNNKTDKGGFQGTAQDLANSIAALEMPDKVLKYGQINLNGLNLSIDANAFAWVLNQIQFLTPGAYAKTITAATDGMYRTDIVAGNNSGSYEVIKGTEAATGAAATEPKVPSGKIKVGYVLVFGNTISKSGNSEGVDLSGELRFPAYPNTRNDGQISMNKVLGTDAYGNLKMFTIAIAPAPFIEELIPDSYLPNTRGDITIKGEFFIPAMCDIVNNPTGIVIRGVTTIHYATFINSGEIKVNVTTGDVEGNFPCTLNNGLSTTKNNALLIVLGTIFIPKPSEWINFSVSKPDVSAEGEVALSVYNTVQSCEWNKKFDYTKKIAVRFKYRRSPLGIFPNGQRYSCIEIRKASGAVLLQFQYELQGTSGAVMFSDSAANGLAPSLIGGNFSDYNSRVEYLEALNPEIRYISGVFYFYINGALQRTFIDTTTENLTLKVNDRYHDIIGIKYIELAS